MREYGRGEQAIFHKQSGPTSLVRYERLPVCVRSNCMTRAAHVKLSATAQDVKARPHKELSEVSSEKKSGTRNTQATVTEASGSQNRR